MSVDQGYDKWLDARSRPMLRFVYGMGGLIPLAYLLGDFLIESGGPTVWPYRAVYLLFWLGLSWATFRAARPLPLRWSYPLYTLVGTAFSCVIDGALLARPETIIATSLLYLIGLVIAWQSTALTAICGLVTVVVPALLLPLLQVPPEAVQRVLLFHLIWSVVASVAALSITRLGRQLHASEAALRTALAEKEAAFASEQRLRASAEEMARTDYLTGLLNRRELMRSGEHAIQESRRYSQPLALLLVDIDHFKAINDTHGHACGDEVIVAVGEMCRHQLRAADFAFRFGGEEFALLLPHSTLAQSVSLAERLRRHVAETSLALPDRPTMNVTVSVGCAQWEASMPDLQALIHRADQALYEAKRAGRNRVVPAA